MCLHVSPRPIALSYHEVPTRVVVPSHIEVSARIVVEVHVGKVVRPVLDSIEAILTFFQVGLRGSAHNGGSREHSRPQEKHGVCEMEGSDQRCGSSLDVLVYYYMRFDLL
jgi:hypothetical protein